MLYNPLVFSEIILNTIYKGIYHGRKSNFKIIFFDDDDDDDDDDDADDDDDEHIFFPEHNSQNNLQEERLKIFAIAWPLSQHMNERTSFMTCFWVILSLWTF